ISPTLANVYLHYVLDLWVEKKLSKEMQGEVKYVRYADDFVCAFSVKADAYHFYEQLPGRLAKFGLEVAGEKTRILDFGRYRGKANRKFEFLGFELSWGKDRNGHKHLKRRTGRCRLRRAIKATSEWIQKNRSKRLPLLIEELNLKLRGHYNYFGVIGNSSGLAWYFHEVCRLLFKWLNRRSQKKSLTWKGFQDRVRKRLHSPRIVELRVLQRKLPGVRC
ncbi:MAG: group II intron reverse transcriptase/maturase, partial [Alphaproteobacteria bacterium]|nr:group II intron reverse transcriptase/maturase [Alphaproteobacteria bacterium]